MLRRGLFNRNFGSWNEEKRAVKMPKGKDFSEGDWEIGLGCSALHLAWLKYKDSRWQIQISEAEIIHVIGQHVRFRLA